MSFFFLLNRRYDRDIVSRRFQTLLYLSLNNCLNKMSRIALCVFQCVNIEGYVMNMSFFLQLKIFQYVALRSRYRVSSISKNVLS